MLDVGSIHGKGKCWYLAQLYFSKMQGISLQAEVTASLSPRVLFTSRTLPHITQHDHLKNTSKASLVIPGNLHFNHFKSSKRKWHEKAMKDMKTYFLHFKRKRRTYNTVSSPEIHLIVVHHCTKVWVCTVQKKGSYWK